jgi:cytochrome c5
MFVLLVAAWIAAAYSGVQTAPQTPAAAPAESGPALRGVLDKYCVACHSQTVKTAGLALDKVDLTTPAANADVWEKVITKLRMGTMPPVGRPRPDTATYDASARWLETEIDRAVAANGPNPGSPSSVHRLNRAEYRNAIRDLLALDIDVSEMLPGDATSDTGFDNNAEVLSISTAQLERYMSAARRITRLATGVPPSGPGFDTYDLPVLLLQEDRQNEELPLGSRGGVAVRHYFPVDGDYLIKVNLRTNYQDFIQGMGSPHQLDIRIDGQLVKRLTVGGQAPGRAVPSSFTSTGEAGDPKWEEIRADGRLRPGSAHAGEGGIASDWRVVRAEDVRAGGHSAAASVRGSPRQRDLLRWVRERRVRVGRRPIQGDRAGRDGQPP